MPTVGHRAVDVSRRARTHENYDAISYMKMHNIVGGYPDGTYKPKQGIRRGEFTKIIMSALFSQQEISGCLSRNPTLFPDTPTTEWYAPYICLAKEKNIVGGGGDGMFRPGDFLNFVEANRILFGAFKLVPLSTYNPNNPDPIWYKVYVDALSAQNAIPSTIKSFSDPILRGEIAEMTYRLKEKITNKPSKTYDQIAGTQSPQEPEEETQGSDAFQAQVDELEKRISAMSPQQRCDTVSSYSARCVQNTQYFTVIHKLYSNNNCSGDLAVGKICEPQEVNCVSNSIDQKIARLPTDDEYTKNYDCEGLSSYLKKFNSAAAAIDADYAFWRIKILKAVDAYCPASYPRDLSPADEYQELACWRSGSVGS